MKQELERMKRTLIIIDMVKGFREEGNMAIKDIIKVRFVIILF